VFRKKYGPINFEDSYTMLLPIFRKSYRKVILRADTFADKMVVAKYEDVFNRSLRVYNEYGRLLLYDEFLIKDFIVYDTGIMISQGKKVSYIYNAPKVFQQMKKYAFYDEFVHGLELYTKLESMNRELQAHKVAVHTFSEIPTALNRYTQGRILVGTAEGNIYTINASKFVEDLRIKGKNKLEYGKYAQPFFQGLKMPITRIYPFEHGFAIALGSINPDKEERDKSPYILDQSSLVLIPKSMNTYYRFPAGLIFKSVADMLIEQDRKARELEEKKLKGELTEEIDIEILKAQNRAKNFIKKVVASGWYVFAISFAGELAGFKIVREREIEQFALPQWQEIDQFIDAFATDDGEIYFIAKVLPQKQKNTKDKNSEKEKSLAYYTVFSFDPIQAGFIPLIKTRRYKFYSISADSTYIYVGYGDMPYGLFAVERDKLREYARSGEILKDIENKTYNFTGVPGKVGEIYVGERVVYLVLGDYNGKLFILGSDLEKKTSKGRSIDMPDPEDIERELFEDGNWF